MAIASDAPERRGGHREPSRLISADAVAGLPGPFRDLNLREHRTQARPPRSVSDCRRANQFVVAALLHRAPAQVWLTSAMSREGRPESFDLCHFAAFIYGRETRQVRRAAWPAAPFHVSFVTRHVTFEHSDDRWIAVAGDTLDPIRHVLPAIVRSTMTAPAFITHRRW
jgi:hypothetical protein